MGVVGLVQKTLCWTIRRCRGGFEDFASSNRDPQFETRLYDVGQNFYATDGVLGPRLIWGLGKAHTLPVLPQ